MVDGDTGDRSYGKKKAKKKAKPSSNVTFQADLGSILTAVLGLDVGKTFPLGVAIDNRTQYDMVQSDGYPFLPSKDDPCVQCGQSGAKSVLGPTAAPIRIDAWTGPDSLSVGAFNGHAVGLDGNVGCQAYDAVDNQGDTVLQVVVAWFMGGGEGCKFAIVAADAAHSWTPAKGYPSAAFLPGRQLATVDGGGTCEFSDNWKDTSTTTTAVAAGKTFTVIGSPGGDKDGYRLSIEVSQQGYAPPPPP